MDAEQRRKKKSGAWRGGSFTSTAFFLQGLDGVRDGQQFRGRN